jgi:ABC-type glycerol-3-phosphate transport system substrate-binding protein
MKGTISRRHLLKASLFVTGGMLAACAPKVVTETVVVEKEVDRVVEVEKIVKEPVEVEKEVTRVIDRVVEVDRAADMEGKLVWDTFRANPPWDEDRLDNFKNLYPNVEVELRMGVADQQANYGRWYAMQAAGDLGDVVQFDPSHFHFWRAVDNNVLIPIDDLIAADDYDLTQFYDQFAKMSEYKGSIWGLPSWGWSGTDSIVVNELVLEEIGVTEIPDPQEFETSWEQIDEWIAKAHIASGDTVQRYGYQFAGGEAGFTIQSRFFGGDFINPEGTQTIFQDDENALRGLRWTYDKVVDKGFTPVPGALGQGVTNDVACAEGRLAMYQGGSLNAINADRAVKDPNVARIGVILFPRRPDGRIASQLRGGAWQVSRLSKVPQIAFEFIKHLSSKEGTFGFNMFGGNTALVRPDVMPLLMAQMPLYSHYLTNLSDGIGINAPANSRGREFTDAIGQNGAALMDAISPMPFDEGIRQLATEVQRVLDEPPA